MNALPINESWSDIALFLAIAEHGTLSAAAEKVGLSQPTLGRRLSALEARLGVSLFARGGRRLKLTDTGAAIMENARRMEREMRAIERMIDVHATGLSGEVTITATEGTGTEWLAPELIEFHQRYPDISINLRVENRTVDLIRREADIALRLGRPTQPDLIARRLVDVAFGLYATREYLNGHAPLERIEQLQAHDVIGMWLDGEVPRMNYFGSDAVPAAPGRMVFAPNSAQAQMSAARAGYGVAVLSCRWAGMYPELVRVMPDLVVGTTELWLVTHEELKHSARIRAVSDFLVERVVRHRSLFESGASSR